MKNTLLKVWGIVLTLAIVAGLLVAAVPAAAGDLKWTDVKTPSTFVSGSELTLLAQTPDGTTQFAWDAANKVLYTSVGGDKWTKLTGLAGKTVNALAVSSNYENDKTLVAGITDGANFYVLRSQNAGATFSRLFGTTVSALDSAAISLAYGLDYDAVNNILLVGTGAKMFAYAIDPVTEGYNFIDQTTLATGALPAGEIMAVSFSSDYIYDTAIYAVVVDPVTDDVSLATRQMGEDGGWTLSAIKADIASTIVSASIAIDSDNGTVYVGLNDGAGANGDVYSGATALVSGGDVTSLSVVEGKIYAGFANGAVKVGTGTAAASAWTAATKAPFGANALVAVTADGDVVAVTNEAAYLAKGGVTNFNATGLISTDAAVAYKDLVVVDANNMFLLADDTTNNFVMKTADAGATWTCILITDLSVKEIALSPAYATDKTVYLPTDDAKLVKSTDAGDTFAKAATMTGGVGKTLAAFAAKDGTTFYAAYNTGAIYKTTRLSKFATLNPAVPASMVVASNGDIIVATAAGAVYKSTDDAVTFTEMEVAGAVGANPNIVLAPDYATSGVVYIASEGGIYKFDTATSTWANLDDSIKATALIVTTTGEMYANDTTVDTTLSIYRSLDGGKNWDEIEGVDSVTYVNAVANTIYGIAGTAIKTYKDTVLAGVELIGPAANAIVATENTTFTWKAYPGISKATYELQIAYDKDFVNETFKKSDIESTIYVYGGDTALIPGQTYYYRVRLVKSGAVSFVSRWSTTTNFSIALDSDVNTGINAVGRIYPENGAALTNKTPSFSWGAVTGATSYDFQLSDKPDFSTTLDSQTGLTGTVYATKVTLNVGTSYYWRVRVLNGTTAYAWVSSTFSVVAPETNAASYPTPIVQPTIVVNNPTPNYTITQTATDTTTPPWVWVIIAIGAVLVIAVVVLIARTRRV